MAMRNLNRVSYPIFLVLAGLLAANPVRAQVDVLTQRYDNARSSTNLKETRLTTSNVNKDHFGKLAFRLVDGNVYAQPLIVSQAKIAGRAEATNVAIVATEANSVYAFDAEDTNQASTTAQLWHTGPLGTPVQTTDLSRRIFPGGFCADLTTEIGITSTPAIALTKQTPPKEGVIFVVAKSIKNNNFAYKLFALNLADGKPLREVLIEGEVKGTGFGSTGTGANAKVRFDPLIQLNRPALLLENNTLYIAFGGHCDRKSYHGWIFAYDVSNPKAPRKLDVLCTTPNGKGSEQEGRAGIWMSGQGPTVDDAGNIYFVTGDGTNNGTTDFGNSVMKVKLANGKIQVQDWFAPQNRDELKTFDADLGSGGTVPVPNSHLLLAGGKEGRMYLIDRDNMGRGAKASLHSFQVTNAPLKRIDMPTKPGDILYWNIHGSPIIWPRSGQMFVYINGEEDHLKQYKLIPDAEPGGAGWKFESDAPFKISKESAPLPNPPNGLPNDKKRENVRMPGGFLSLSADGDKEGTGIVWVTMPYAESANMKVVQGVLRAFDASDVSKGQLWSSEDEGIPTDSLGMFAKFCPPTVANGKVYVATFQQERVDDNGVRQKMIGGDQPALAIYGLK
jgi:hypothetical protein